MKYDVKCTVCEHATEVSHSITEEHPPCNVCGNEVKTYFPQGTKLANTQFKGSGWADKGKGGTK